LLNASALGEQKIAEFEETRDRQALGVPNFSREAAFLLNAMAALPRKWVSDGAPTLPWIHGSALRDKLI
jgi:hypothetical protein